MLDLWGGGSCGGNLGGILDSVDFSVQYVIRYTFSIYSYSPGSIFTRFVVTLLHLTRTFLISLASFVKTLFPTAYGVPD